jgi:AcrR family transcriptional regulator
MLYIACYKTGGIYSMPPRISFDRDSIIKAAFELVEERGLQELSARKVAEKLNSSQAPIYTQFKNIEDLKEEVLTQGKELLFEYVKKPFTDRPFLNIGVGVSIFSRDHQHLYQAIFSKKDMGQEILEFLTTQMTEDTRFTEVPLEVRRSLLRKMAIATFGLVDMMAKGLIQNQSDEAIIQTLFEMGTAVIMAEFNQNGRDGK